MAYTGTAAQDALIALVEYRADQLLASGQTLGVSKERMYAELEHATRVLIRTAEAPLLYSMRESAVGFGTVIWADDKVTVPLPDGSTSASNFLRFLRVVLPHLKVPISALGSPTEPEYALQANPYSRRDIYRPVGFLVPNLAGGYAVEVYPGHTATVPPTVSELLYVGETAPESVPLELQPFTTYMAASTVLINERRPGEGQVAAQLAAASLTAARVAA